LQDVSTQMKIELAKKFVNKNVNNNNTGKTSFVLDYKTLLGDADLKRDWPDFKTDLKCNAEKVMGIFGLAARNEDEVVISRPRLKGFKEVTQVSLVFLRV
jgi:hypothetical protein